MMAEDTQTALNVLGPAVTGGQRFRELDSIRGLAALIVVLHHFRAMWFYEESQTLSLRTILTYPLFAGRESVLLFFLLSGFVLAIPYIQGNSQPYPNFLLRRVLRIYCPYLCALALAVAGNAVWHGSLGLGFWADQSWTTPVHGMVVLENVLMVGIRPMLQFNPAFWSLVIEMRMSIVFPLLFWWVRRMPAWAGLVTAAMCSLGVQLTDQMHGELFRWLSTLEYVAVFLCGILMAIHLPRLGEAYRRLSGWGKAAVAVGSFLLFDYTHVLIWGTPGALRLERWHVQNWPILAGAAGLILMGLESKTARAFLNSAVPRFLGRISYSLYLVHATVLYGLTFVLIHKATPLVVFLIFVPVTLAVSTAFCLWVEEPFLRLGRRVSRVRRA